MRTTLTLDADLHRLLLEAAHRAGRPFKRVLNDTVRAGLAAPALRAEPFTQPVFSLGRPRVDLTKALALADDLEDQERVTKMAQK
jgi:hypothetical protein